MAFRDEIEKIRSQNTHLVAAQDWDVMDFVRTVRDFHKLRSELMKDRRVYEQYRNILVRFYTRFKNNIFSTLRKRGDGQKLHNAVYKTLFGKQWGMRFQAAKSERGQAADGFKKSVISAILSYPRQHSGELRTHLGTMSFFSPVILGKKIKNVVVEDVQAALKTIDREDTLDAVLGQRALIYQALVDLLGNIMKSQKMRVLSGSGREVKRFAEPIFDKIILEIEAKKALVHGHMAHAA